MLFIQVQQRPFHSRLKVTKTKRKPFFPPYTATGIPLPENLLPESDFPITTSSTSTEQPAEKLSPVWVPEHSESDKESSTLADLFPPRNETGEDDDDDDDDKKNYFPNGEHLGHVYFPDDNNKIKLPVGPKPSGTKLILPQTSTTVTTTTTTTTTTKVPTTTTASTTMKPETFIGPIRPPRPTFQQKPDEIILTTKKPPPILPTTRKPLYGPGLVFDDRPANVVTAATFRPPASKNPDVFDVVVTANQNFGNSGQPVVAEDDNALIHGKPQNDFSGKYLFYLRY